MGGIDIHLTEQPEREKGNIKANTPLVIALAGAFLLLVLFVAVMEANGQRAAVETDVSFGSISGRVVTSDTDRKDLAGIRVLVRRVHSGFADFHFDRLTAADGSFELEYLLPGRYMVELDPRTMPDAILQGSRTVMIVDVAANAASDTQIAVTRASIRPRSASVTTTRARKQD